MIKYENLSSTSNFYKKAFLAHAMVITISIKIWGDHAVKMKVINDKVKLQQQRRVIHVIQVIMYCKSHKLHFC